LRIQLSEDTFRAPGGESFLAHAGRLAAARRPVRFAFDRTPQHRHDEKEPWQPRNVFLQQITLNLPRAAYAAAETDDWFAEIERALHVALRAHAAKRDFASRMMGRGAAGPWALLCRARDGRRYFDPHGAWCLIGVDGLHEAINYLTRDIDDAGDAAHALGVRAMTFLAERCFALGRKLDLRIALAPNNDRAVGARFAARDLEQFPQTMSFLDGRIPAGSDVAYTPGVRLAPGAVSSPIERVRIEGLFHRALRFGAQTEAPLPDGALSEHSLAGFLKKTWRQTQNRCIVFE
jgi:ribonucleoside-triphosphate reductase